MAVNENGTIKFIKYSLFAFNLVFWAIGAALIGIGIWFIVDSKGLLSHVPSAVLATVSELPILSAGIAVITIGGIITITGFLGCFGAVRESRWMLGTFAAILILIFAAMLAIGIFAFVSPDMVRSSFKQIMELEVQYQQTGILHSCHQKWQCCGIESQRLGCDRAYPPMELCFIGSKRCSSGCLDALWNNALKPSANAAGIALLVTCGILIVGIVFSFTLCCRLRSSNRSPYADTPMNRWR